MMAKQKGRLLNCIFSRQQLPHLLPDQDERQESIKMPEKMKKQPGQHSLKLQTSFWFAILFFCCAVMNIFCGPVQGCDDVIVVNYEFSPPAIEKAGKYNVVSLNGLARFGAPGEPVLPYKTARILLPSGRQADQIKVICAKKQRLQGSYLIEPGQKDYPGNYQGPLEPTPPNAAIYSSKKPFPGKTFSSPSNQRKMGYTILMLNLHPVQYVPKEGSLSYYQAMRVEVRTKALKTLTCKITSTETKLGYPAYPKAPQKRSVFQDQEALRSLADNPVVLDCYQAGQMATDFAARSLNQAQYEYVIITTEALSEDSGDYYGYDFLDLVAAKQARGISAVIVTVDGDYNGDGSPDGGIYANYDGTRPDGGNDNQTKIRHFIIDAYNNWNTRYILLGGDADYGNPVIPVRYFLEVHHDTETLQIPSDIYYGCLDGTFDDNADGIYGEYGDGENGGEVDLLAEVYVGRACIDNRWELNNFVAKTLSYESSSDSYLQRGLMVTKENDITRANTKDLVIEGNCLTIGGSSYCKTTGFHNANCTAPDSWNISTLYETDYSWSKQTLLGIINNGVHIINNYGHGNYDTFMKINSGDVDALTNTKYFIGYSMSCLVGNFVTPDGDCILEHMTMGEHGAAAYVGSSGLAWTYTSPDYDQEFFDAILGECIFELGRALQDAKEDIPFTSEYNRQTFFELLLFGDPALKIKHIDADQYQGDDDFDGINNDLDNCPAMPNGQNFGTCSPGSSNAGAGCISDGQCAGSCGAAVFCSMNQEDTDADGYGDVCDNCPDICNVQQRDEDNDGTGDVCDPDSGCGRCGDPCETGC